MLAAAPRHDFVAWIFSSSVMMDSRWSMSPMSLKMFMLANSCARCCSSNTPRSSSAPQVSKIGIKLPPCSTLTRSSAAQPNSSRPEAPVTALLTSIAAHDSQTVCASEHD